MGKFLFRIMSYHTGGPSDTFNKNIHPHCYPETLVEIKDNIMVPHSSWGNATMWRPMEDLHVVVE